MDSNVFSHCKSTQKNRFGPGPRAWQKLLFVINLFDVDEADLNNALLPTLLIDVKNIVGGIRPIFQSSFCPVFIQCSSLHFPLASVKWSIWKCVIILLWWGDVMTLLGYVQLNKEANIVDTVSMNNVDSTTLFNTFSSTLNKLILSFSYVQLLTAQLAIKQTWEARWQFTKFTFYTMCWIQHYYTM